MSSVLLYTIYTVTGWAVGAFAFYWILRSIGTKAIDQSDHEALVAVSLLWPVIIIGFIFAFIYWLFTRRNLWQDSVSHPKTREYFDDSQ